MSITFQELSFQVISGRILKISTINYSKTVQALSLSAYGSGFFHWSEKVSGKRGPEKILFAVKILVKEMSWLCLEKAQKTSSVEGETGEKAVLS